MWIAFRFCIFVLWTQYCISWAAERDSCELLSDFVSSFFEHNRRRLHKFLSPVVNCFQILYLRSLNTISGCLGYFANLLWIAFRFCIFVLWTQWHNILAVYRRSCELLSDFVSSFFEHNRVCLYWFHYCVVNCFQILYLRSLNTIIGRLVPLYCMLWIAFRFCIFVLWTQYAQFYAVRKTVVNCFQILYLRSLNTIWHQASPSWQRLWIAFRFCIFVLWTQ